MANPWAILGENTLWIPLVLLGIFLSFFFSGINLIVS